MNGLKYK